MYRNLGTLDLSKLGGPRLAEIGKIKIGGKGKEISTQKGKKMRVPEKYDHFVITSNVRDDATGDFIPDRETMKRIAEMTDQDPERLKRLPVVLLFDEPSMNFQTRYSCYTGNSPWCVGDGTRALRRIGNGKLQEVECPCERSFPDYRGKEKCKIYGRLAVVLRGVERIGGCWMFRTTSWNSCKNILSSMHLIRQITGGILAGIPLEMTISPKTVVTPDGVQRTVWVVNLEFPGSWEQLAEMGLAIHRKRLEYRIKAEVLEEQVRNQLSALPELPEDEEGGVTPRDIQEEFFPENSRNVVELENGTEVDPETGEVVQERERKNPKDASPPGEALSGENEGSGKSAEPVKPSTEIAEGADHVPTSGTIRETLF